jgi:catalase
MSKKLTTNAGCPVVDNQNVMTAGPRGPQLLQDVWFLEKLAHFYREVIPERRMHAKGSGAYGTCTVTHDITKYTRANLRSPTSVNHRSRSTALPIIGISARMTTITFRSRAHCSGL